jgi:hypothetical protein
VDAVVVAEDGARAPLRPGQRWLLKRAAEVALVEALEHAPEVVDAALRRRDHLAPALPAREVRGAQHLGREGVVAVDALVEGRRAAAAQEFRDEDEGERAVDVDWSVFENVGEPDVDAPRAQPYRVVQARVRVVAHVNLGHRALGRERAESLGEEC